jgi:hypothetical protein
LLIKKTSKIISELNDDFFEVILFSLGRILGGQQTAMQFRDKMFIVLTE